jgi:outer membrane murein-binding lipoprotein Lpp
MKKLVLTLVAGAFGSLLVLPIAHAADYEDMSNDASSIRQDQRDIHHDRQEQREDIENGNFGAAAREQAEIQQRRANENATKEDLNRDLNDSEYGRRHHDDDRD